jgi:hypothetical protein
MTRALHLLACCVFVSGASGGSKGLVIGLCLSDNVQSNECPDGRVDVCCLLSDWFSLTSPSVLGGVLGISGARGNSYLVDPASSHMLVSKIKPCMSKYKQICTVKLRMAH